jgi:peptidoglycan/xylan/chitin deacetylase (PgdA/CDA1 family)
MNIMTVDLDCNLQSSMRKTYSNRICDTTRDILEMLRKSNALATFFILGYVAERHPELFEDIISQGHEVATHGHFDVNFKNKIREDFEQDLVKSLDVLRTVSQEKIRGFRAPFFSINKNNAWTFEALKEYVEYDSSIFPLKMHYCSSGARNHSYRIRHRDPFKIDDIGNFLTYRLQCSMRQL